MINKVQTAQNTNTPISPTKPECYHKIGLLRLIRKNIGAFLEYLWELSGSIRLYKIDAVLVEGKEKHTGQTLTSFYMGRYDNYKLIFTKMYSEFEAVKRHKNLCSLNVKKWIKKHEESVDFIFIDVELLYCKLLRKEEFIQIPHWTRQKFEVPDTWEGVLSKFRKNTKKTDLRKVRKYNFTYKITRSEKDFKDFYYKMHKPYLEKRFDELVIIEPEWKFMRQCRKGELMQIIRGTEVVAGILLHLSEGRLAYVWVGVPDNVQGDLFRGVFSAMYYFTIVYGYENGCHEIDFLGTRPLLDDGLFRYKRKWGTYVQDSPVPRGDILLKPLRFNASVRSFFSNNYFITKDGKNLVGKILFEKAIMSKKELELTAKNFFTHGLRYLIIYSMFGFEDDARTWAHTKASEIKIFDLSESSNPHITFSSS